MWRCCRLCRSGDAEPRAASWSRRRWPWHWYIQGRQWTPLQRAEWCAALCRTFPASAGRPAEGEFTSMAASGAAWSGSLFKTLLPNVFAPPQTQASAALCSLKLRSLSPSSRPAPLSGKASSLSASSGSLSKGFLIPLSAGDGQSLLCGRPRIDTSLATRWRTERHSLLNHQNRHSKVTRACGRVYAKCILFFRVCGRVWIQIWIGNRPHTHTLELSVWGGCRKVAI